VLQEQEPAELSVNPCRYTAMQCLLGQGFLLCPCSITDASRLLACSAAGINESRIILVQRTPVIHSVLKQH
jgi:hypothetical protein